MTAELVTGYSAEPHITAIQDGARNTAIFGSDNYILNSRNKLAASMQDSTTVYIDTGDVLMQGRHIACDSPSTVTISSGQTNYNRIDLICLKYTKDSETGVEQVEWEVIKGTATTGTATTPSYTTGNLITGEATLNYLPIFSVKISGLTPSTPTRLLNFTDGLTTMGDTLTTLNTTVNNYTNYTWTFLADGNISAQKSTTGGSLHTVTFPVFFQGNSNYKDFYTVSGNSLKVLKKGVYEFNLTLGIQTTANVDRFFQLRMEKSSTEYYWNYDNYIPKANTSWIEFSINNAVFNLTTSDSVTIYEYISGGNSYKVHLGLPETWLTVKYLGVS